MFYNETCFDHFPNLWSLKLEDCHIWIWIMGHLKDIFYFGKRAYVYWSNNIATTCELYVTLWTLSKLEDKT